MLQEIKLSAVRVTEELVELSDWSAPMTMTKGVVVMAG
jgi:hypothetical protein